ncbi:MAG: large conductance mechanosensitive channel protein [Candidatus Parcubacteria bacterium]|nr:large conductance mechanosensitive channel protein [Candidatus Parcubacteria bacterium]
MFKDFKQFLLRGNVVDLAVGVVVGAAFTSVVNALVADLLTPFISTVANIPDLSHLVFTVHGSTFAYGHLLNALISFVLVASTVFFFVVKPINVLVSRSRRQPPADPTTKKCPECMSEIPIQAKRCSHCTQVIA